MCEYCLNDITAEIVLSNGECHDVCDNHIFTCIQDYASKENPVHAINDIDISEI